MKDRFFFSVIQHPFSKHFLGKSKLGLTHDMEYKVFHERDGTEIEDDECLIEFGKLGGPIIIGLQWQSIATTAPTPVAATVSQPTAPTASASTIAPSTLAAPIVDTSITSQASEIQEVDDIRPMILLLILVLVQVLILAKAQTSPALAEKILQLVNDRSLNK